MKRVNQRYRHKLTIFRIKRNKQNQGLNACIKVYPTFINIHCCDFAQWSDNALKAKKRPIDERNNERGLEYQRDDEISAESEKIALEAKENAKKRQRTDSYNRAKNKIFDIAILNEWDYFVTLTFDDSMVNALDYEAVKQAVISWTKNNSRNYGLSYLIVPELHPTSGRVHLHGLIKCDDKAHLKLNDSMKRTNKGQTVYNLGLWNKGFSTAIPLYGDNNEAIATYMTKYITKDMLKLGKLYYCGRVENREATKIYTHIDYKTFVGKEYINECGTKHKYRKDRLNIDIE